MYFVEMGQMSDYDIQSKQKIWAGSLNKCQMFGQTSPNVCMYG